MNNEERDLIANFVARASGAPQPGGFGSVPATAPSLPPIDPEADRFIGENFQRYPEARYRITQMAVVQEAALAAAQNRIKQLEWQLQQAQTALQQSQQQPRGAGGGGFLGGLFGGGQRAQTQSPPPGWGQQPQYAAPPPQPTYPQGMNGGMFPQRGSGFLGSALTTAAGVAGGMMAANAIEGLFSGHHDAGGWGGAPGETIINNNYGDAAGGGDPFAGGGGGVDQGFDANSFGDGGGGFDGGGFDGGGFDDNSF
ncbi:hypothetical protein AA103196_2495 [Ameyamaea chiangmaiensis NBRC 103196]|uniref:DUF2076 domain-containing protein n=1 Tax=Ameyamaea chiangmaiensis TaxID=442969 RepID=A0A850P6L0_9PROT|nr:DUF2076 domain-containing protein [Ameyamaea chiangmaiensis]MBS4075702.1 DUF2076 domain-containing protein [Ameyamaea chiangmaiensis]NVN40275.1 DUF2076 domain-containing protein [Ameyamaea chiangmaiensis]GBQ70456.1 hypothetical protein AA103196_2495 [Ameyamaea chiangmaiensis NBRC 103196]